MYPASKTQVKKLASMLCSFGKFSCSRCISIHRVFAVVRRRVRGGRVAVDGPPDTDTLYSVSRFEAVRVGGGLVGEAMVILSLRRSSSVVPCAESSGSVVMVVGNLPEYVPAFAVRRLILS